LDVDAAREYLLAQAVEEEARLAIEVAAVHRGDEMADQTDRHRRFEEHRRLAGGDLARTKARGGAARSVAPERTRLGEARRHARARVPVVALHEPFVLGDHRAGEVVPRAGIPGDEAVAVREHELRLL